jgi:2-polyprenyl-3-methyl-5-hydroxy-6-metoxy-1,4-benzoquinol methylase
MPEPTGDSRLAESEKSWFAGYYEEERFHPFGMHLRMERDLRLLRKESDRGTLGRVLSIGCGDGRFERMVARHADHVHASDLSPEAIAIARQCAADEGLTNITFEVGAAAELGWEGPFDVVLCMALLHHLPEKEIAPFVQDLFERVAPGGLLYTLDPNVDAILRKVGRIVLGQRYNNYHTADEREIDPRETEEILRQAGFSQVRYLPVDWTLIPVMYLFPRGPNWPLRICGWTDRVCNHLPFRRWASGFSLAATKSRS